MKRSRKQKKRDKMARKTQLQTHHRARDWDRLSRVLVAVGAVDEFNGLPKNLKERIRALLGWDLRVKLDPSAEGCADAETARQLIDSTLRETPLKTETGHSMMLADYLTVFSSMNALLDEKCVVTFEGKKDTRRLAELTRQFHGQHDLLVDFKVESLLAHVVNQCSQVDQKLIGYNMRPELWANGNKVWVVKVYRTPAQRIDVLIDGRPRPVFRCGACTFRKIIWSSFPAHVLGLDSKLAPFPVYIQSHALRQLDERLPLVGNEGVTTFFLCDAFRQPEVVARRADDWLVSYRVGTHRLGYLVVTLLTDKIVVRTFLFLTMQGTPEAELLRKKLSLYRPDIEHLELDRMETFLQTDLRKDSGLVRILNECNCGHLLAFKPEYHDVCRTGIAASVRKYLGPRIEKLENSWKAIAG